MFFRDFRKLTRSTRHRLSHHQPGEGLPFEVDLPAAGTITGVALAGHVKNLDWEARRVVFEGKVPSDVLTEVRERLRALLDL